LCFHRKEYSYREDEALIKWVLKTKGDVKGNAVWQALEAKKIIPGTVIVEQV